MAAANLTAERVRELFNYDPDTGIFTQKISSVHLSEVGKIVGVRCGTKQRPYVLITAEKCKYGAHRIAWLHYYGIWPIGIIDHLNGDGTDNRISNLRLTDYAGNAKNHVRHKNNISGVMGVAWRPEKNCWRAYICLNRKQIALGHYDNIIDAVAARKRAEQHYGFHENHGRPILAKNPAIASLLQQPGQPLTPRQQVGLYIL